jgi:hypothetical protein
MPRRESQITGIKQLTDVPVKLILDRQQTIQTTNREQLFKTTKRRITNEARTNHAQNS